MLRTRLVALAFVPLLGCPGPAPAPAPAPTPPTPAEPTPAEPTIKGLGEKCGPSDSCPTSQSCVKYYGIAGASGPQFSSCEIPCAGETACPDGTTCITIADGPGRVCRPAQAE